ncbi:MAG: hypothetical protein H6Q89_601 [Myxococcaceae bacterium]|nr:hypothetical protein [Myxococcaceae bacterium]
MARRAYVPSGKSDPGALPRLAVAAALAAVLGGLVLGFVSQWLSLLLIYPAALGAVIGGVGVSRVKSRHVRQPLAVALIGLGAGLLGETSLHLVKYARFRSELATMLNNNPGAAAYVEANGLDAAVDAALTEESATPPILGYLELAARNGVTITKAGHSSSSSKPTLTGVGVYALWVINFLIVCGIAVGMLVSEARKPFCEGCVGWYDATHPLAFGAGDSPTVKQAVLRLEGSQYAEAARNLGASDGKSATRLTLLGCAKCNAHEPLIELTRITGLKGNKPHEKKVFVSLISPSEAAQLRAATRPAPAS